MASFNIWLARLVIRIILGLYWGASLLNLIQVHHGEKALRALRKGKVLIISNHPSLLETWLLPALFWRLPEERVPWTVADQDLMPKSWAKVFRLILVNRHCSQKGVMTVNGRAIVQARGVIKRDGNVILYPEGGRTCKGAVASMLGNRKLRQVQIRLITNLAQEGVTILPVWVTHGNVESPEGFVRGFWKLFLGTPLVMAFGQPLTGKVNEETVTKAILGAGREPD